MSLLHAQIEVVEGATQGAVLGLSETASTRTFVVLTLRDETGNEGVGEASPLPGYSPDTTEQVVEELRELIEEPIEVDGALGPRDLLERSADIQLMSSPSARFALETAILDWLGKVRNAPLHRLLSSGPFRGSPVCALVVEPEPTAWAGQASKHVAEGYAALKFKVGADLPTELEVLRDIRSRHPDVEMRLDGNGRIDVAQLEKHLEALRALNLTMFEEPVPFEQWPTAVSLSLPFALDETLADETMTRELLPHDHVVAAVFKLAVIGGVTAALDLGDIVRRHGVEPVLSHTFDGPIARAASAEVALATQSSRAAGLGPHPVLSLWPDHEIASISGQLIRPHDNPGIGLVWSERDG